MKIRLGEKTFQDIMNQDKAWKTVLADKLEYKKIVDKFKNNGLEKVIFVGCGSSYYISLSGSFVFSKLTSIESYAVPGSEIIFYPEVYLNVDKKTIVIAVSRSGETIEVIKAIEKIKDKSNIITMALTCYEDSNLAKICDYTLLSRNGKEESVVMTKSFTSLLLGIQLFSGLWIEDDKYIEELNLLPSYFKEKIQNWKETMKEFTSNYSFEKHEFLGQGNFYGLVNEAMLKMKEMAIAPSEDFHSLEFRHGPKSIIDHKTLVSMYIGDNTYESEKRLCKELIDYGATLLLICNQADEELRSSKQLIIDLNTDISQLALTPLALVPNQLLAYYTAVNKGIDVDNPRNLTQVVENI